MVQPSNIPGYNLSSASPPYIAPAIHLVQRALPQNAEEIASCASSLSRGKACERLRDKQTGSWTISKTPAGKYFAIGLQDGKIFCSMEKTAQDLYKEIEEEKSKYDTRLFFAAEQSVPVVAPAQPSLPPVQVQQEMTFVPRAIPQSAAEIDRCLVLISPPKVTIGNVFQKLANGQWTIVKYHQDDNKYHVFGRNINGSLSRLSSDTAEELLRAIETENTGGKRKYTPENFRVPARSEAPMQPWQQQLYQFQQSQQAWQLQQNVPLNQLNKDGFFAPQQFQQAWQLQQAQQAQPLYNAPQFEELDVYSDRGGYCYDANKTREEIINHLNSEFPNVTDGDWIIWRNSKEACYQILKKQNNTFTFLDVPRCNQNKPGLEKDELYNKFSSQFLMTYSLDPSRLLTPAKKFVLDLAKSGLDLAHFDVKSPDQVSKLTTELEKLDHVSAAQLFANVSNILPANAPMGEGYEFDIQTQYAILESISELFLNENHGYRRHQPVTENVDISNNYFPLEGQVYNAGLNHIYLNASAMAFEKNSYIASQAPYNSYCAEQNVKNFLRVIAQGETDTVVTLTSNTSGVQWWDFKNWRRDNQQEGSPVDLGDGYKIQEIPGSVSIEDSVQNADADEHIITRQFQVTDPFGKTRMITHFYYKNWQDQQPPRNLSMFNKLLIRVSQAHQKGPIVVHCTAGIGRTGTFIGAHSLWEEIKQKLDNRYSLVQIMISPLKRLFEMRLKRGAEYNIKNRLTGMVQSCKQYQFIKQSLAQLIGNYQQSVAQPPRGKCG